MFLCRCCSGAGIWIQACDGLCRAWEQIKNTAPQITGGSSGEERGLNQNNNNGN